MIKNYYFLTAALLSFIFAIGHYYWGEVNIIAKLQSQGVDKALVALVFMGWNLAAMTTLLSGVALLLLSAQFISSGVRPLAWFIVAINIGRYFLLLGTILFTSSYELQTFIAQTITLFLYVGIIVIGIQKTQK